MSHLSCLCFWLYNTYSPAQISQAAVSPLKVCPLQNSGCKFCKQNMEKRYKRGLIDMYDSETFKSSTVEYWFTISVLNSSCDSRELCTMSWGSGLRLSGGTGSPMVRHKKIEVDKKKAIESIKMNMGIVCLYGFVSSCWLLTYLDIVWSRFYSTLSM